MPFSQITPRPLLPEAVKKYAPGESGVYGISNAKEWIYIGETDNIQGALLEHLAQPNTPLMHRQPTGFVFEICDVNPFFGIGDSVHSRFPRSVPFHGFRQQTPRSELIKWH
jgi:hypothetical protein